MIKEIGFNLINNENLYLIILGFIWIIGAILQDLKRREVDNLWNFSLIFIALAYRGFVGVFNSDIWFFLNGLIGLIIFYGLGNLFYYGKLFAGGDAKLLIALGTILPLSYDWIINLKIFGIFVFLLFGLGAIYGIFYSLIIVFYNFNKFKKEFKKQWKINKKFFIAVFIFVFLWVILLLYIKIIEIIFIAFIVFIFPFLFVYAKSVEKCMIKLTKPEDLTEGDWLEKDILIKGKKIKSRWDGLSRQEINLLKKYKKKVLIKQGIPFTPSFLFAFIVLFFVWKLFKVF